MKNLLFIFFAIFALTSCQTGSGYGKLTGTSPVYEMKVQGKNGDDSKVDVTFSIESTLVDSLKISEDTLKILCERACLYSDFSVKFPLTWKFSTESKPMLIYSDGDISVIMSGSAKNAFGVDSRVMTYIKFDNNYNVVVEDILSF